MGLAWATFKRHAAYCLPQFTLMFAVTIPVALMGALSDDPELGLDNASINGALAAAALMKAIGKAVNGITVDVFGVGPFLTVAMLVPGAAAVALGGCRGKSDLVAVFGVLAFCNSGAWLCAAKLIEGSFRREQWGGCFSLLATCSRLGTMVARVVLGSMLAILHWRTIACGTASVLLTSWMFTTQVLLRSSRSRMRYPSADPQDVPSQHVQCDAKAVCHLPATMEGKREPRWTRIRNMLCNRGLQLQACIISCASCIMALENMCPLLLKDAIGLGNAQIGMLGTLFPAAVLASVLICGQLYAKLITAGQRLRLELLMQGCATMSLASLTWLLAPRDVADPRPPSLTTVLPLLCVAGFGMGVNFYVRPGIHSLEFGDDCATASSILDGAGQATTVVFQLAVSSLFDRGGGWHHVLGIATALAFAMSLSTLALFLEQRRHVLVDPAAKARDNGGKATFHPALAPKPAAPGALRRARVLVIVMVLGGILCGMQAYTLALGTGAAALPDVVRAAPPAAGALPSTVAAGRGARPAAAPAPMQQSATQRVSGDTSGSHGAAADMATHPANEAVDAPRQDSPPAHAVPRTLPSQSASGAFGGSQSPREAQGAEGNVAQGTPFVASAGG